MRLRFCGALLGVGLGVALAVPAHGQRQLTIAVMPAGWFAADAKSARNLTHGLVAQFEQKGYKIVPAADVRRAAHSLHLNEKRHYPDRSAVKLGRMVKADLVAYPRLLAVGIPVANPRMATDGKGLLAPATVVHLRVLNVKSGSAIYFRQIAHEFRIGTDVTVPTAADFTLPQPVATASASEASQMYFERVAGSRSEYHNAATERTQGDRMQRR